MPHPSGGEDGYILEVFNAVGESINVIAVPISAVQALKNNEIITVRSLDESDSVRRIVEEVLASLNIGSLLVKHFLPKFDIVVCGLLWKHGF
ncbi:MAG: hypothetical protein RID09_04930 [Coleofasciculus sp. G1-WW12-02]